MELPDKQQNLGSIYLITNKVNGKKYVGRTIKNIQERLKQHLRNATKGTCRLSQAIINFGQENFEISNLDKANWLDLPDLETKWIQKLDTYHNGYNMTENGNGTLGFYTNSAKGKKLGPRLPEIVEKIAKSNTGQTRNNLTRGKISEAKISYANVAIRKSKLRNIVWGKNPRPGRIEILQIDPYMDIVVQHFRSLKAAAEHIQVKTSVIRYAFQTDRVVNGFKWEVAPMSALKYRKLKNV